MAVMMNSETVIPDEAYDGMAAMAAEHLRRWPGFVAHFARREGELMKVTEIWESADECARFFAEVVHPNLPPGVKPKRVVTELRNLIKK
jgi:heme-degrading monooxygenase HmoA